MNDRMVIYILYGCTAVSYTHRALRDRVLKIRVGATDAVVVRPERRAAARQRHASVSREPGAEWHDRGTGRNEKNNGNIGNAENAGVGSGGTLCMFIDYTPACTGSRVRAETPSTQGHCQVQLNGYV